MLKFESLSFFARSPPLVFIMKRFLSLFVVFALSLSLCTFAFAIEPIPEFSSDFVRYAPSTGAVSVGGSDVAITVPWIRHSSSSTRLVSGLDAQCSALGDLHGHFTFVFIIGSENYPTTISNVRTMYIETIDSSTSLHSYFSYLRPTNYRYEYKYLLGDGSYDSFTCIPYICEFDIPEGETFTSLSMWGSASQRQICYVSGDFITSAFFLYSPIFNSSDSHLNAIEDYLSILPRYCLIFDETLHGILDVADDIYSRVQTMYSFMNTFTARFNTDYSKAATWDNMPSTTNGYNRLADMVNAVVNEKKRQADREVTLSDLTDVQDSVISKASDNLPKFASGILNIFDFFDVSDSDVSFDIGNAFLGYEDYFGNVPFFFSSDIESRLEVQ